jgi:glucose-1-phosphate thymidylyltransferase
MYPLTQDRAKPLLPVAGKPILGHLVDQLESIGSFDEIIVVANARFHAQFVEWGDGRVTVLNDGATTEESRRGAVGDLAWALEHRGVREPFLVAAGDNLFKDSLEAFVADYEANPRNLILRYRETDREKLQRTGVAEIDRDGRLVRLEEKPQDPTTDWACPALYILEADALGELATYVEEKPGADALGSFIAWLAPRVPLFTHEMQGSRLDVGELEGYARAESWLTNGV